MPAQKLGTRGGHGSWGGRPLRCVRLRGRTGHPLHVAVARRLQAGRGLVAVRGPGLGEALVERRRQVQTGDHSVMAESTRRGGAACVTELAVPPFPTTRSLATGPTQRGGPVAAVGRWRWARACSTGAGASSGTASGSGSARPAVLPIAALCRGGPSGGLAVCLDRAAVSADGVRRSTRTAGGAVRRGRVGDYRGGAAFAGGRGRQEVGGADVRAHARSSAAALSFEALQRSSPRRSLTGCSWPALCPVVEAVPKFRPADRVPRRRRVRRPGVGPRPLGHHVLDAITGVLADAPDRDRMGAAVTAAQWCRAKAWLG
ncbi:hypothetical protein SUDANB38_00030 [Streptomyces sp. enrichment culture]